jgi:hypothetical protein
MDASSALWTVLLGGFLGMVGQLARTVVGIKKEMDAAKAPGAKNKNFGDWFDIKQLVISILIGGVAGVIAILSTNTNANAIDNKFMLGIMASGYAGSDFIEGFMTKNLPK